MRFLALTKLAFFLVLTVFFAGCLQRAQETSPLDSKELRIAVVYPITTVDKTTFFWQGLSLAAEEINKEGGIHEKQVTLLRYDDKGSVTEGIAIAQSLAERKDIVAVIGHWNSRVTIPVSAIYENAPRIMISAASTAPNVTREDYNYVFQQITDDWELGRKVAELTHTMGLTRVVSYYASDAYGYGLVNSFEDHLKPYGITLVDRVSSLGSDLEAQRLVAIWQALDVEGVFLAQVLPEAGLVIQRLRRAGLDVPILGGTGLSRVDFMESLGEDAEGIFIATPFNPYRNDARTQHFVRAFSAKYGRIPDLWAAQGYDTLHLLGAAMKKATALEAKNIGDALRSLQGFEGVVGPLSFDQRGKIKGSTVVLKQVQDGQFSYPFMQDINLVQEEEH